MCIDPFHVRLHQSKEISPRRHGGHRVGDDIRMDRGPSSPQRGAGLRPHAAGRATPRASSPRSAHSSPQRGAGLSPRVERSPRPRGRSVTRGQHESARPAPPPTGAEEPGAPGTTPRRHPHDPLHIPTGLSICAADAEWAAPPIRISPGPEGNRPPRWSCVPTDLSGSSGGGSPGRKSSRDACRT